MSGVHEVHPEVNVVPIGGLLPAEDVSSSPLHWYHHTTITLTCTLNKQQVISTCTERKWNVAALAKLSHFIFQSPSLCLNCYIAELYSRARFIHSECFDFRDSHSLIPRLSPLKREEPGNEARTVTYRYNQGTLSYSPHSWPQDGSKSWWDPGRLE